MSWLINYFWHTRAWHESERRLVIIVVCCGLSYVQHQATGISDDFSSIETSKSYFNKCLFFIQTAFIRRNVSELLVCEKNTEHKFIVCEKLFQILLEIMVKNHCKIRLSDPNLLCNAVQQILIFRKKHLWWKILVVNVMIRCLSGGKEIKITVILWRLGCTWSETTIVVSDLMGQISVKFESRKCAVFVFADSFCVTLPYTSKVLHWIGYDMGCSIHDPDLCVMLAGLVTGSMPKAFPIEEHDLGCWLLLNVCSHAHII